jgi:hypothetical protein
MGEPFASNRRSAQYRRSPEKQYLIKSKEEMPMNSSWKTSVRAATTGNDITLNGTQTIDVVALAVGDRVLVKDQATASQNGIYVVAAGAWKRADDANTSALMEPGMVVRVCEGNDNGGLNVNFGGTEWILTTTGPITLGTTDLVFAQTDLLRSNTFGQFLGFQGNLQADGDIFAITNNLPDGKSDNPQAYLAASLAGYGGICTGVHGRNGNGSPQQPTVGVGVYGDSDNGPGVYGSSASFDAVVGETQSDAHAGVTGRNLTTGASGGVGVYGVGGQFGGKFDGGLLVNGNATITGTASMNSANITGTGAVSGDFSVGGKVSANDVILAGRDCAEEFDIAQAEQLEPGTVVVFDSEGAISQSTEPYNKRVAGVISGAGKYRPGVILGREGLSGEGRAPVALMGRVYCKVDAFYSPIEVGDLLTTCPTPGHAMKADDRLKAFGSVIGKALQSMSAGQKGLIPILVALQ